MNESASPRPEPDPRRHYAEALATVRSAIAADVRALEEAYLTVEQILTSRNVTFTKGRGIPDPVVDIIAGLIAKGCKTVRAIRVVALEGSPEDAMVLLRSLYETAVAVQWLLQRDTRRRTMLYVAHGTYRRLLQLKEMSKTPGQKRAGRPGLKAQQELFDEYARALGGAIQTVTSHWGGGLENVVRRLGPPVWRRLYNSFYRYASNHAHAGDAQLHYRYRKDQTAHPKIIVNLMPMSESLAYTLGTSAWLLLMCAKRMNDRLGMGRDEQFNSALVKVNARMGEVK